jgi:hypothetical protein
MEDGKTNRAKKRKHSYTNFAYDAWIRKRQWTFSRAWIQSQRTVMATNPFFQHDCDIPYQEFRWSTEEDVKDSKEMSYPWGPETNDDATNGFWMTWILHATHTLFFRFHFPSCSFNAYMDGGGQCDDITTISVPLSPLAKRLAWEQVQPFRKRLGVDMLRSIIQFAAFPLPLALTPTTRNYHHVTVSSSPRFSERFD